MTSMSVKHHVSAVPTPPATSLTIADIQTLASEARLLGAPDNAELRVRTRLSFSTHSPVFEAQFDWDTAE